MDLEDWPEAWLESSKISIDGGPEKENPDVAWVHHHTLAEKTYACLTLQRTGHLPSKSDAGEVNIFFVRELYTSLPRGDPSGGWLGKGGIPGLTREQEFQQGPNDCDQENNQTPVNTGEQL